MSERKTLVCKNGLTVNIRRMTQDDVFAVVQIEEAVVDFPWTYGIFSDCVKVGYDCWVVEHDSEVIGYGLLSMGDREAHVLNICIIPPMQRRGIGWQLMNHLLERARTLKAQSVYLEVRASNEGAYDLYQKLGFSVIGHRKDYYPHKEGREDAIVLELCFEAHSSNG